MKKIFSHWKTTSAGIATIAGGIVTLIEYPHQAVAGITAILGGIGLIFAPDASSNNTDKPTP